VRPAHPGIRTVVHESWGDFVRSRASTTPALLAVLTTAVLGISALTGCQPSDDTEKKGAAPTASTPATSSAPVEPSAVKPSTTKPSTVAPSTGRPSTARPSTTIKDKKLAPVARAGGLVRITGDGAPTDVPVDPGKVDAGVNNVLVTAFGGSTSGPRTVLFVGVDGLTGLDGKRLEHLVRGMVEYVNGDGGSVPEDMRMKDYAPGPQGGTLECMPGSLAKPAAICAWADMYTAAVAYFDDLSADQAAVKFAAMRADLEK
jgi:hypothetical protein